MGALFNIRSACVADAPALLGIYRPYVEQTAVSFELQAPTPEEFALRVAKALEGWAWLVAEADGQLAGYAYASVHRERPAYRWSVETSAYVSPAFQGQGCGGQLYDALLAQLASAGFCQGFAGIALPNAASVALHQRAGFEPIGVFQRVGHKFGAWHDVGWWQRRLRDEPGC